MSKMLITLAHCKRFCPDTNSPPESDPNSPQLNCPDTAEPQGCTENLNASEFATNSSDETEIIQTNGRLRRPGKKRAPCGLGSTKTRNAYLNFVKDFRKDHNNLPPRQIMSQAACSWKRLSEDERCRYKTDAQNAEYVYKSKNRMLNKILKSLKSAVALKDIDVGELSKASRQIHRWKDEVLDSIESVEEQFI